MIKTRSTNKRLFFIGQLKIYEYFPKILIQLTGIKLNLILKIIYRMEYSLRKTIPFIIM